MAKKISLFSVDDQIMTPEGPATVLDVRGRGWQKVDGVPKTWWKTEDLIELNPTFAETYEAALAEEEAKKADRAAGGPGKKLEKLKERKAAITARIEILQTQSAEVDEAIKALEAGEPLPAKPKKAKKDKTTESATEAPEEVPAEEPVAV